MTADPPGDDSAEKGPPLTAKRSPAAHATGDGEAALAAPAVVSPTPEPSVDAAYDPNRTAVATPGCAVTSAIFDDGNAAASVASGEATSELPMRDRSRYEFVREHARGGLGKITIARDRELGRLVAVKELLSQGNTARARFVREAMITARLEHPAIVPIYEAGRWSSGEPFYAMKLVSGRSLAAVLKEKRPLAERLALLPNIIAVADAIAYAHSEQVIHRDLKPSNIMLGDYGETVVIDWGLAKDMTRPDEVLDLLAQPKQLAGGSDLTAPGSVIGTPVYMPPEQALGMPVGERADVYSLGAILYHLLAGRAPYGGDSDDEVLDLVRRSKLVPLKECAPSIPDNLAAIVAKAMATSPLTRYSSGKTLAEALRRQQAETVVGQADTVVGQAETGAGTMSSHGVAAGRTWIARHQMAATAALILVLGAIASATWLCLR